MLESMTNFFDVKKKQFYYSPHGHIILYHHFQLNFLAWLALGKERP